MAATNPVSKLGQTLLIALLVVSSLLALLPEAIGFGLRYWLDDQGLSDAWLEDVDFNPFSGKLRLQTLHAQQTGRPALELRLGELDIDWWPLTRRQAVIHNLYLGGLELALEQGPEGRLVLNGILLPAGGSDTGPAWGIALDKLTLVNSHIRLRLPGFKQSLLVEQATLTGLRSWEADQPARLILTMSLGQARIELDTELRPFAATRTLDGRLRIEGLDLATLATDLKAQLPPDLTLDSARLGADIEVSARQGSNTLSVTQQGTIVVRDTRLGLDARRLDINRLDWQGTLHWSPADGPGAEGELKITGLTAAEPARKLLLARLGSLHVPRLQLAEDQALLIDGLTIDRPLLLSPADDDGKALFSATRASLAASRADVSGSMLLGELDIQDAHVQLTLDKDRKLELPGGLQAESTAPAPASDAAKATDTSPPHLALAGLRLTGGTRLSFHDRAASPPFQQTLLVENLTVGPLDNQAAGQDTPFALKGRVGEYSAIQLSGNARPLADKLNLTLDGDIKAVELPPLSSYTADKLGYNLQSGQLNAGIALKIRDDQLDGVAKLVLNRLAVKAADPEKLQQLTRELSMPLDSALNMLRDSDDNIRLKLPVTGDIHSPDFDLSDVINKAMGKALRTAALTYVKFALQPYGTLLTIVQKAGEKAQQAALKPIDFAANAQAPGDETSPYLDKLAGLLRDRPKMTLRLCGVAVEADRQARLAAAKAQPKQQPETTDQGVDGKPPAIQVADEELLQLAGARAAGVKRWLVNRGIAPGRLFLCNPELDAAEGAKPRLDLLL